MYIYIYIYKFIIYNISLTIRSELALSTAPEDMSLIRNMSIINNQTVVKSNSYKTNVQTN